MALTLLVVVSMVLGTGRGRLALARWNVQIRSWAFSLAGGKLSREEFESVRLQERRQGVELVRGFLARAIRESGPSLKRFLDLAGMSPNSAVIRWGNLDWTLVLSSKVFEPDDSGRSYRMKPGVRSVWLINLTLHDALAMFLVPDDPEILAAGQAVGGRVVPESVQTTNSWGCRGPEPDLSAPVRVLVLGDSMMQGLLVGDDETPSECLRRDLSKTLNCRVSVLNTGVLGYSLEQYYYTMSEFFDRLKPQIVVIGICGNDLGDPKSPEDQAENAYWIGRISQFCRTREVIFLFVPAPQEQDLLGRRNIVRYPGPVSQALGLGGLNYYDPTSVFTNEEIRLVDEQIRQGTRQPWSPLYNGHLGDHHFSATGCSLWGRSVANRLERIWRHVSLVNPSRRAPGPK